MEARIQYAKTSDGVNIAYSSVGDGSPLLAMPTPAMTHRGETELRGFEDPVRLYELRWERPDAG